MKNTKKEIEFKIVKCTDENFAERYTGDMVRDYEMLTPEEWLSIYGDDEPDLSYLEQEIN